jgi:uncharacterized protein (DUF1015 family)
MAIFRPFKAFRPSVENQKLIPQLPYDVMSSDEARDMAKGNDLSFLHIDRAEIDFDKSVDEYSMQVYEKARENLLKLENNGDMIQDKTPSLYIYRQVMNGAAQTGIVGCASIDDYKNNVIKKHEFTLAQKEQDRINHVNVCDANTGPIFLTYRHKDEIDKIVEQWILSHEPLYDFEFNKVNQTVWIVDDINVIENLQALFEDIDSLYIADGHHRCASAVKVGEMRRQQYPDYSGNEEFNYFLAIAFADKDLRIMDYNRLVKDLNGLSFEEFIGKISEKFDVEQVETKQSPSEKHTIMMYYNEKWYKLTAKDNTFDENDPIERLDVSILQNNLLEPILNIKDPKNDSRIDFVGGIRGLDELVKRANDDMKLAFAMYPTTIEDLMMIADDGKIMPPKSTWFEPKLLSGLFVHHLS